MQTEIDKRFKEIEERLDKLENKGSFIPDNIPLNRDKERNSIVKGMVKSAMAKEALASVALDKGVTQTISEEIKPLKNTGRTGNA